MAQIQDSTTKPNPRNSLLFLGCFGFSRKVPEKKLSQDTMKSGSRRKTRWLSCSSFRMKKSAVKTVPVETSVSENFSRAKEIQSLNSDKKVADKAPYQTLNDKPHKKRCENAADIILESRERLYPLDSIEDDTCQKGLIPSRKKAVKGNGVNSPKNKSLSSRATAVLCHSVSFPPPKRTKQAAAVGGDSRVNEKKPLRENLIFSGQFDPLVGMSIIMVTLIIMLFWGKLCAILCTSAWLFFVPRLRRARESDVSMKNGLNSGQPDLDSEEYKKKVVLEGFLNRNHRNVAGFL